MVKITRTREINQIAKRASVRRIDAIGELYDDRKFVLVGNERTSVDGHNQFLSPERFDYRPSNRCFGSIGRRRP